MIVSRKATYDPGDQINFSQVVPYTVTAQDQSTKDYEVTVTRALSPLKGMNIAFHIDGKEYSFDLDNLTSKVSEFAKLPHIIDLAKISPLITVSEGASYEPKNLTDFSKAVEFTVTAEDHSTQNYSLNLSRNASPEKELILVNFTVDGETFTANAKNKFQVELPYFVNLAKLTNPTVVVSHRANYIPQDQTNFSKVVPYTVIAENLSTNRQDVTVTRQLSPEKELILIDFIVDGKTFTANEKNKYRVELPYTVDLKDIKPSKIEVSPIATYTPQNQTDFRGTVPYIVTAENQSTQEYPVNITRAPSPEKELIFVRFTVDGETFSANAKNKYQVKLPYTVDLDNIKPKWVYVSPRANYAPRNQTNFTEPVIYTVTAENQSTKDQKVTVTRYFSPEKELTLDFTIDDKNFTANRDNNHTIRVKSEILDKIDLGNLTPTVEVSRRANYTPEHRDFNEPVVYTVTAEDQSTEDYEVKIYRLTGKFISVWKTFGSNQTITLPIHQGGKYDFTIDWGDGTETETITNDNFLEGRKHTYPQADTYTITISTVEFEGFNFNLVPNSADNFIRVEEWGNIALGKNIGHFKNCKNLEAFSESDAPDLSKTESFKSLFQGATKFDSNLNDWDTKHITNMQEMFYNAKAFNNGANKINPSRPLTFGTDAVESMYSMFNRASSFNQEIKFNTPKVTNMSSMFYHAYAFNNGATKADSIKPLTLDAPKLKYMENMFWNAKAFNQEVKGNTPELLSLFHTFQGAISFNQQINLTTSSVVTMESMFNSASSFNQEIKFNTSSVISMGSMFAKAKAFNNGATEQDSIKPLNLNTNKVKSMALMFLEASSFNQKLPFNTSSVITMQYMFSNTKSSFNQPINHWDVQNVFDCYAFRTGNSVLETHHEPKFKCDQEENHEYRFDLNDHL